MRCTEYVLERRGWKGAGGARSRERERERERVRKRGREVGREGGRDMHGILI
jgi:hypothetical protein